VSGKVSRWCSLSRTVIREYRFGVRNTVVELGGQRVLTDFVSTKIARVS